MDKTFIVHIHERNKHPRGVEWTTRLVDRVWKKGDGRNLRDHRDVTLLGHMLRMLERMMGGQMEAGRE